MSRLAATLACLVCVSQQSHAVPPNRIRFDADEVVAFLGGTNCVNVQNAGHLESWLTQHAATSRVRFIDLAWEGDTVDRQGTVIERWREDKWGNLSKQLRDHRVTTAILMFGQLEALNGKQGLEEFSKGFESLLETCLEENRNVLVISPFPFEPAKSPLPDLSQRNADLEAFTEAMKRISSHPKVRFVDLLSRFEKNKPSTRLTRFGLHVRPEAQDVYARAVMRELGVDAELTVDEELRAAVIKKHRLWMDYWRPANWKCLYGDDGERQFGKATGGGLTLRQEWSRLPELITKAEDEVWGIADGSRTEAAK